MIKQLKRIRETKPLVLNLTNVVTMDFMANVLLAVGAAPIMSLAGEELDELIQIASSVHINIGTLDNAFNARCQKALELAQHYQKPVILDPVGAGASQIRSQTAMSLLPGVDIVRGNASEIMALAAQHHQTLGVESVHTTVEAEALAMHLAKTYDLTVVVSGEIDFVTDGRQSWQLACGSPMMPLVTGMGCSLTAMIAAFRACSEDSIQSARDATLFYGLCGQLAEEASQGPGSFRSAFIDKLYQAEASELKRMTAPSLIDLLQS